MNPNTAPPTACTVHTIRVMLGSSEYPVFTEVLVQGESSVPGFFVCTNARGERLVVHRERISLVPAGSEKDL